VAKVILEEAAIRTKFEIPRPLCHGGFDDLVADYQKNISRARAGVSSVSLPIRCFQGNGLIDGIRSADYHSETVEKIREVVELALGVIHDYLGHRPAAESAFRPSPREVRPKGWFVAHFGRPSR
jgi:hypothetical protein